MQTLLFSRTVELQPHIIFSCTVNGKELTARVTHVEHTGVQILHHVSFSDGHQDAYVAGEPEVREGFGRTRTMDRYEEAIFEDLSILKHMEKGSLFFHVRVCEKGGESFNVWVKEKRGYYSVYYKGEYQFTLRNKERWETGTMRERGYVVNQELARLLSRYIDQHYLKKRRELKRA